MRARRIPTLLLAAILAVPAWAQGNAKIGYVNFSRLVESAPQIALAKEKLDTELRPRYTQIEGREQELRELEERLQRDSAIMGAGEVRNLEQRIRSMRREVQRDREDLADELDFRLNEEMQRVEDEIFEILSEFATEMGYDLILPGPALYVSESIDLTDQLVARMRARFEADDGE